MDGGTIESLLPFLRFGLLGLAAIIFILAIIGYLAGNIDETRARLLRTFLFIGALFGGLAFLTEMFRPEPVNSEYELQVQVLPHDQQANQDLPAPIITVGGSLVERTLSNAVLIAKDTNLTVDISHAVGTFEQQAETLQLTSLQLAEAEVRLENQDAALASASRQFQVISGQIEELKASGRLTVPEIDMLGRSFDNFGRALIMR